MTGCHFCGSKDAQREAMGEPACRECGERMANDPAGTLWDRIPNDFIDTNPVGEKYIKPSKHLIEVHAPWMAEMDRWFTWTWSNTGQKIPHRGDEPTRRTSWQEVGAQVSLEEAWENYVEHGHAGIGFGFTADMNIVLEDFDDTIEPDTGEVAEIMRDVRIRDDEPIFVSSSGTGAHRYPVAPDAENTSRHPHEVYTTERFAAVTGHVLNPTESDHGTDLSIRVNELSDMFNESSGMGAALGDIDFDADPVELERGDWEPPEALEETGECVKTLTYALSTHDPTADEGPGWGQNTFGRYSYLIMLLAENGYSGAETREGRVSDIASAVASFRSPAIAAAQRGDHFKKPEMPEKHGKGVPWDLGYQVNTIVRKIEQGDLTAPSVPTIEENTNVQIGGCNCHRHSGRGKADEAIAMPEALSERERRRSDRVELNRARADVRRTMSQPIDGPLIYHAPQGLGKTRFTPRGAEDVPRLVITTNKGEHRETLKWACENAGVTCDEVTPFGESWLASGASPVQDEVLLLYEAGVQPRFIIEEYKSVMPDDVECPYLEQFEGEPPDADVLLGSPGHENVARFRQYPPLEEGGDPREREVIYDDVNPADHEISQNTFALDASRAELNELLQAIPQLDSDSVEQLMEDLDDMRRVERIAVGDGEEEPEGESESVWDELKRRAQESNAINVDLVDIVRRSEEVRGESIIKLKVVAGAEIRGVDAFSWRSGGDEYYSWVSHPDLSQHEVAVLSATHMPHVTEQWLEAACGESPVHETATDDWRAVRRAQGYLLIQTRSARNSRSGAGSHADDTSARRKTMRESRDDLVDAIERAEGTEPGVIDAKKLLDEDGMNFARVWSNNRFRDKDVGLVSGATYYGDEWVQARAAYCGATVDIVHEPGVKAHTGHPIGSDLLEYMTKTAVEQAVTRFGRSTDGRTRVYVDTDAVPPHFPTIDASDHVIRTTETEQAVYEAVSDGASRISEVAERVDVTRQQVGNVLWRLEGFGIVDIERFALEYGAHRVGISENGPISISKIEFSETPTETEDGTLRTEVRRDPQTEKGDDGAQLTIERFGGHPG